MDPVPMAQARRKLTEIVDDARDKDLSTALTEYGRPRAFVVSVAFFEAALLAGEVVRLLQDRDPALFGELLDGLNVAKVPPRMVEAPRSARESADS